MVGDDGSAGDQGMLEVIEQIPRVLDTNAQPDQIFWQATFSANSGGDRGMSGWSVLLHR